MLQLTLQLALQSHNCFYHHAKAPQKQFHQTKQLRIRDNKPTAIKHNFHLKKVETHGILCKEEKT